MMCVLRDCDMGGSTGCIWVKDTQVWWSSEWIVRRNVVILYRCAYYVKVSMISVSQGHWVGTRVVCEFIFEMM